MRCEEFHGFIDAYVDQEFDGREQAEMQAHIGSCPACRQKVDFEVKFKHELKSCLEEKAPDALRNRIFEELELELQRTPTPEVEAEVIPLPAAAAARDVPVKTPWLIRNARIIGPLAAVVLVAFMLPSFTVAPAKSGQLPIVAQTVDWHVGNYPIEVTGPEPSRVTQWFRTKVDFPVRLPQFEGQEVNLLGGRIAHVQDRRAAYLLYEVDGSRMSVLVFDGEGLTIPSDKIRQIEGRDVAVLNTKGYEVAVLQDGGVTYTITSELEEGAFIDVVAASLR